MFDSSAQAGLSADSSPSHCLNCGQVLVGPFCAHCGQRDHDLRVSWTHFLREFAEELFHFEAKLPRTLWLLVSRPGALTRLFLEGKRVEYLGPFKLYVLCSLFFFLVTSVLPKAHGGSLRTQMDVAGNALIATGEKLNGTEQISAVTPDGKLNLRVGADAPAWVQRLVDRTRGKTPLELGSEISAALRHYMPDAMFVLLPVFALLLKLLYRDRYVTEHVVTALHLHAAGFLWLLLMRLSPFPALGGILFLAGVTYLLFALRRVYRGGWLKTVVKAGFALATYTVLLALTVATVTVVGLVLA